MPRGRAVDYDDKRTAVLDAAAALFGELGYTGAKMDDVAKRCNVSKSMVYHYFKKMEDMLFAIQQEHVLTSAGPLYLDRQESRHAQH